MELTESQLAILDAEGHLLVTGGPGSGKTTISIVKAARIAERDLHPAQQVLFLSFARATVSRVVEAIEHEQRIPRAQRSKIDVQTYHSFFWRILQTHGYLLGLPRRLSILTPPAEAIALLPVRSGFAVESTLTDVERNEKEALEDLERRRLAHEEGRICFDLFAPCVGDILDGSERIRRLMATMYPVVILDEFQDTNPEQWRVVQALGKCITLIALGDPEQRIYDFIGADPERLNHFRDTFAPTEVDLRTENHRNAGTQIAMFGNDLLSGQFRQDRYDGVEVRCYEGNPGQAMTALVTTIYSARTRLVDSGKEDWSLAILVPTKKMTRRVSDSLRAPPAEMTAIPHVPVIELEAAILGAELVAFLMQPDLDGRHFERFIELLCDYFRGKGGDTPTKGDLAEASRIRAAFDDWLTRRAAGKEIKRNSILTKTRDVYGSARAVRLTGDPDRDWREMRRTLEMGECSRLRGVADEIRNLRLLDRGTQVRLELSDDWRATKGYHNALAIIRRAFVREHFSTNARPERGVVVMNMHKAKGKQFDEVIIFEGWPRIAGGRIRANADRIVRGNSPGSIDDQVRQNLRVSVTRARQRVTLLTPKPDPCVLLV